ncbi:MAG: formate dehydrogenase accessory sulfurtransferase FdhD [Bacteroidota bacterium]|nr:formate dehydrogenase accessory sulfurtransferase FdhD [Bacteroidota bacterium]MDP4244534.1 formate dehydrogenase accessory sulfurtransferase FdhD [Bacteroidota bacterium]MDP4256057.1 formate dehydrogenase accessory sulfurtransferase FdhD [Bacteroidota bacterium]MDP4259950.1 formate dehydrogenase accessory sulfurtransferase FdhD [Bacteroidota bacterium]
MENSCVQLPIVRITGGTAVSVSDLLAIEEPLEIRIGYGPAPARTIQNLAVTMRTPGDDESLALGFLFTEGIIPNADSVDRIEHVFTSCYEDRQNAIQVTLKEGLMPDLGKADRNFYASSSCGVCGKASIAAIRTVSRASKPNRDADPIDPRLILELPGRLAGVQRIFADTGGLHAAALFDEKAELLLVKEDVGRHNALDKLIGSALRSLPASFTRSILLLSGRASFELVQKAAMAGIPIIAAVGAPSSLAASLAEEFGITLIGFLRPSRFNIYSVTDRIQLPVYETI